eukprot:506562_1
MSDNSPLLNSKINQPYDFLGVSSDSSLRAVFRHEGESLQFAEQVMKINKYDKHQKRALIVSNVAIYNFNLGKYSRPKRKILISHIESVILTRSSDELLLRVKNSYDYRYEVPQKAELLEVLVSTYLQQTGEELSIQFSDRNTLKDLVKTRDQCLRQQHRSYSDPSTSSADDLNLSADGQKLGILLTQLKDVGISLGDAPQSAPTSHRPSPDSPGGPSADSGPVETIREGWLSKRKGKSEVYELKYFRLRDNYIEYLTARIKECWNLGNCTTRIVKADSQVSKVYLLGDSLHRTQCCSLQDEMEATNLVNAFQSASNGTSEVFAI